MGQPDETTPDALRAFLWGKRQSQRHAAALNVVVRGSVRPIPALSLNVSASGVLLRIALDELAPDGNDELDPFMLIQTHFRGPCLANFKKLRVKAHLEAVRLDIRTDEPGFLFIGCQFSRPLDAKQLSRFGLTPDSVGPEQHGLPSEMMPLRCADDPVVCRLFGGIKGEKLMFEGRVLGLGLGQNTLCLQLHGTSVDSVTKQLRDKIFHVGVLNGDKVAWRARAQLQTIGFPRGGDNDGLELGLVIDKKPRPSLTKKFQAA